MLVKKTKKGLMLMLEDEKSVEDVANSDAFFSNDLTIAYDANLTLYIKDNNSGRAYNFENYHILLRDGYDFLEYDKDFELIYEFFEED